MEPFTTLALSAASRSTAGILLVTVVAIAFGGWFLTTIARGKEQATPFQRSFFVAGHAHAGVLVILGLVCQVFVDETTLDGPMLAIARSGVPLAAILMSAGFFLSAMGRGATRPNRLIVLLWLGAASLVAGVLTLGIGLLTA
jgi:hypothetical protein